MIPFWHSQKGCNEQGCLHGYPGQPFLVYDCTMMLVQSHVTFSRQGPVTLKVSYPGYSGERVRISVGLWRSRASQKRRPTAGFCGKAGGVSRPKLGSNSVGQAAYQQRIGPTLSRGTPPTAGRWCQRWFTDIE